MFGLNLFNINSSKSYLSNATWQLVVPFQPVQKQYCTKASRVSTDN